jgi:hypothetical protein
MGMWCTAGTATDLFREGLTGVLDVCDHVLATFDVAVARGPQPAESKEQSGGMDDSEDA